MCASVIGYTITPTSRRHTTVAMLLVLLVVVVLHFHSVQFFFALLFLPIHVMGVLIELQRLRLRDTLLDLHETKAFGLKRFNRMHWQNFFPVSD